MCTENPSAKFFSCSHYYLSFFPQYDFHKHMLPPLSISPARCCFAAADMYCNERKKILDFIPRCCVQLILLLSVGLLGNFTLCAFFFARQYNNAELTHCSSVVPATADCKRCEKKEKSQEKENCLCLIKA